MLQKELVLFFVLGSMAGFTGCGNTSSHYVYATIPVASQIVAYREDPNSGVLTQISGSPYSVGQGAISLVLHPSGKFLYVANPGIGGTAEHDISLFSIASDGVDCDLRCDSGTTHTGWHSQHRRNQSLRARNRRKRLTSLRGEQQRIVKFYRRLHH